MNEYSIKYNSDFLRITWAHAVNSKTSLIASLKDDIDCIESDLTYCSDDNEVYMSHPPLLRSDLTFKEYWDICKFTKKIIKLDFKMIESVEPCLKILNQENKSNLILNADILKSSISNKEPVNKESFLKLCHRYLPEAAISIGWTTVNASSIGYTWSDIYEMNQVLHQFKESDNLITIPVDAHMTSLNSIPRLIFLLDQFSKGNVSITIWAYKNAVINVESIKALRQSLGRKSIFLDVPQLLDSEKQEILAVEPSSDGVRKIICSNISGNNFWSSRSCVMIGENTSLTIDASLLDKMEFYIVFDNSIAQSSDGMSNCDVSIRSTVEVIKLLAVTNRGYSLGDKVIEKHDKYGIVYFVSITVDNSMMSLFVSTVSQYNTNSIQLTNQITTTKELHPDVVFTLAINARSCDPECRFIVVDFLTKL